MKKVWKYCIALMLALVLVLASGCNPNYRPEFEYGDFICREWFEGVISILDLSEQGKEKRVIIVPDEINGLPVGEIADHSKWTGAQWESKYLEKIYLPKALSVEHTAFVYCENLYAIFILKNQGESYHQNYGAEGRLFYTNKNVYDEVYTTSVFGRPANVSYYYNDGRTENYGCYWLDDVPYGSLLDVLPPEDPASEGKTFAGWYKEPECINAWNFETDTTPEEKVDEEGNVIYQETALYAKWV